MRLPVLFFIEIMMDETSRPSLERQDSGELQGVLDTLNQLIARERERDTQIATLTAAVSELRANVMGG